MRKIMHAHNRIIQRSLVSTVKCEFSSQKCYSVDCCFVLGWWVQCHVLCQQWCCACWSWWNIQSYEACCCTGDARLGSVNYFFKKFLELVLKISGVQMEYGNNRLTILMILLRNQQIIRNTESFEDWCCTGDTWLGAVNYTFRKFVMRVVFKTHFKQTCMTLLQCQADD